MTAIRRRLIGRGRSVEGLARPDRHREVSGTVWRARSGYPRSAQPIFATMRIPDNAMCGALVIRAYFSRFRALQCDHARAGRGGAVGNATIATIPTCLRL